MISKRLAGSIVAAALGVAGASANPTPEKEQAAKILETTGVRGGLVVHLGCGEGELTAALRASDGYLVQGLESNLKRVEAAREYIRANGLYGAASVERWDGASLPYADNLVNLVVCENLGAVPMPEVMRVLAPRGVAYLKSGGEWRVTTKPWPVGMDEWTHHLHDAGGNAVANDTLVGPPRQLQWTAGPLWSRSHGWSPSVSAMVSAGGRMFYICDETLTGVDGTVPDKWFLVARDAFNGVLLWKRPVPHWGSKDFSGTPGTGAGSTTGRFTMPPNVGKRLVASADTVYVTLGADAPVTALDAATGGELRVYPDTERADEILHVGGRLIVATHPEERDAAAPASDKAEPPAPVPGKRVCAVDADTGKVLWNKGPFTGIRATRTQDPHGRLEMAAGDGRVFVLTDRNIEVLSMDTGATAWRIDRPAVPDGAARRVGFAGMYEFLLTVMVYHDGVLLLAQPEPNAPHTYHTMPGALYAFDARDGRPLWKRAYGAWGHCTQPDVFVARDMVWTHAHAEAPAKTDAKGWLKVADTSGIQYGIQGLDLRTGETKKEFASRDLFNVGHHHRCYRNKSTERFLMASRRGVEFVDLDSGENFQNHWVRSGCLLGNLPCNGLLYVAPHDCGCYIEAKLAGFNALAPGSSGRGQESEAEGDSRLDKGPAYKAIGHRSSAIENQDDWPTYRHDARRSGATECSLAAGAGILWEAKAGARPSAPVVADGKAFVAGADDHSVRAFDAEDGRGVWTHTADARVDSPPTIWNGLVIFGSADGYVHALRAADGALAWRFRAAPRERRVVAFDQLESPWPVPGSVLVQDGKCWFAAGRSSYLDGGIRLYALDAATGEIVRAETLYHADPVTGKMAVETDAQKMAGVLNDIPGSDGANVFIRQMNVSSPDAAGDNHLFTTAGYRDSSWFNRTFWKFGRAQTSGLMVLGENVVYGMELYASRSRETVFEPGANTYRLVCLPLQAPAAKAVRKGRASGIAEPKPVWQTRLPIRVTALVRAADKLFAAGAPDIVDPADPHAAFEGRKGGVLAVFGAADGGKLAETKLPAPPVWDGMAAAAGRLFLSLEDGRVICVGAKPAPVPAL